MPPFKKNKRYYYLFHPLVKQQRLPAHQNFATSIGNLSRSHKNIQDQSAGNEQSHLLCLVLKHAF